MAPDEQPAALAETPAKTPGEIDPPLKISDERLKLALIHRLLFEGVLSDPIDLRVSEGIVELEGEVRTLGERDDVVDLAYGTKGVRGIVDELEIQAPDIDDEILRARVKDALLFDSATESYEIDVGVSDQAVSLKGEVDSWAERELAQEVAASVLGVEAVENHIAISSPAVRPDGEIKRDIVRRLETDVLVDAELLDIDVAAGNVTLSGTVGSSAEKDRAFRKAWVAGVTRVELGDVDVQWWNRDRFEQPARQRLSGDGEIRAAVEDALRFDERIDESEIHSYLHNGKVTLTGAVPSLREKKLAEETARNTVGVARVDNFLRVEPEEEQPDERIEERVERALTFNPYLQNWKGTVDVQNGHVTLRGTLATANQKRQALGVAQRVIGVKSVDDQLSVFVREMDDLQMKDEVLDLLYWNIFVDPDQVQVSVDRGMVTLSGTVADRLAYREAAKSARLAGAEVVYNKLAIAHDEG